MTPLLRPIDNRQSTMSIDKFVVDSSNCRRLCPALQVSGKGNKGSKGSKGAIMYITYPSYVYNGMIEEVNDTSCIYA